MAFVYSILGAGRQGTAAAWDLATRGEAREVRLIDAAAPAAERAVERLGLLLRSGHAGRARPRLVAVGCDAADSKALGRAIAGSHAVLSAVPFRFNVPAARAALAARCHFNDLGGNTDVVREELALDAQAREAKVSIVPDCGLAPGMCQSLAVYAMSKLAEPRHVRIWCGGLPQHPRPPLDYQLVFNVGGLANEYTGTAIVLRGGRVTPVPAFTEREEIEFPAPIGRCEAFLTSGGTSTAPWTHEGRLETYVYKTVRYRGHFERVRCLIDLGFLDTAPVTVAGREVVPREMAHVLLERALAFPDDPDLVVLRVEASGGGDEAYRIDLLDFHDAETGFTAMERTTAFPAAIVTYLQASGAVPPGATPLETCVPADRFVSLLEMRPFKLVHARL